MSQSITIKQETNDAIVSEQEKNIILVAQNILKGDKGDTGIGSTGIGSTETVNGIPPILGNVTITQADIGLGNVTNTSDANKPVSTAQQTALDLKVDKIVGKGLSTNDLTNAGLATLNNQSGVNTGDETLTSIKTKLGVSILSGSNTGDQDLNGLLVKANNLSDLTSTSAAITNLGLGTLATQSGTFSGTSSGTNTGDQLLPTLASLGAEATSNKNSSGGYAGLSGFSLQLKNAANTFINIISNATTSARTWTFPDKSGTVAMLSDIVNVAILPSFVGTVTVVATTTLQAAIPSPAQGSYSFVIATSLYYQYLSGVWVASNDPGGAMYSGAPTVSDFLPYAPARQITYLYTG